MREKELRLALVCYGGISLAVYMHGITKEVWHLARASRHHHDGAPTTGVEAAYADLLAESENSGGTRLRVLADIVAGASAGGINGIFLAQAIATGQSLDPLTELWLSSADVEVLIAADAAPSRFSKLWALPLAWAAGRGTDPTESLDEATRDEVRAKLSHFVRSRWFEPPFGGAVFTGLLLDAFAAMAQAERGPRLLPDGQPLDLFVTVTDFTGHPERLRLNSPPEVLETEHRLVLGFTDDGHMGGGGLGETPDLAFAARATSSFPGAFPPFGVAELDAVLAARDLPWPGRRDFLSRALPRQAAAGTVDAAVLIDGSVLANAPFRPAIEALAQRPARREVDRRFVYIDPSPGPKFRLGGGSGPPSFVQTILGAISELPRQQPIRDNLEAIAARSDRIDRLRGILDQVRPAVDAAVEQLFGRTLFLRLTPARLAGWRARAHKAAAADAGIAYAAYDRLKREGVLDLAADLANQAALGRGTGRRARLRAALATALAEADPVDLLRRYDLRFRIRRLRLLARRAAELESDHPEADLAPARQAIYAALAGYLDALRAEHHASLRRTARATRADGGPLAEALAASLDLHRLDAETDATLATALAGLPRPLRRALLLAYLGFLYFDIATFPLLQGEGLDEFDPIRVDRIAPDDATAIRAGGAEATLKGIRFNSFGAFFSRGYRENDYLWGRLHGAERMIDIAVSALPRHARMRPGRVAALKRAAFHAILDEEAPRLSTATQMIASLRREVG